MSIYQYDLVGWKLKTFKQDVMKLKMEIQADKQIVYEQKKI